MDIELHRLLNPVTPEEFLESYWDQKSLYIPGSAGKFDLLGFNLDAFKKAALRGSPENIAAAYVDAEDFFHEFIVSPRQLEDLYAAGMSICFGFISNFHPQLGAFATAFRQHLHHAGKIHFNAYLSPPGKGFNLHFDSKSVVVMQIEGSKLWRYSERPGVLSPPIGIHPSNKIEVRNFRMENPWADFDIPEEEELTEQLLQPGDLLYLPPGAWHCTVATTAEYSLSLSLTCTPMNFVSLCASVLERVLQKEYAWRRDLPSALATKASTENPDTRVESFFSSRLEEMKEALAGLDAKIITDLWRETVSGKLRETATEATEASITATDLIHVPNPITFEEGIDDDGEPSVFVSALNKSVTMGRAALPFIQTLANHKSFIAKSAMGWSDSEAGYSWEEVQEALEGLLLSGVIRREASN